VNEIDENLLKNAFNTNASIEKRFRWQGEQIAVLTKHLAESNEAHNGKNAEINLLRATSKQSLEALREADARIDQLTREVERLRVLAPCMTPPAPPKQPRPEKPNAPPMPSTEWYFSEKDWQWNTIPVSSPTPPFLLYIRETGGTHRKERFEAVRLALQQTFGGNVGFDVYDLLTNSNNPR
jgi:hypothetical protein